MIVFISTRTSQYGRSDLRLHQVPQRLRFLLSIVIALYNKVEYAAKKQPSSRWVASQCPSMPCVYEEQCPLSTSLIRRMHNNKNEERGDKNPFVFYRIM